MTPSWPGWRRIATATRLRFELRFTPKDRVIANELGVGKIQFAAIGCGSYLVAHAKYGVIFGLLDAMVRVVE